VDIGSPSHSAIPRRTKRLPMTIPTREAAFPGLTPTRYAMTQAPRLLSVERVRLRNPLPVDQKEQAACQRQTEPRQRRHLLPPVNRAVSQRVMLGYSRPGAPARRTWRRVSAPAPPAAAFVDRRRSLHEPRGRPCACCVCRLLDRRGG